MMDLANKVILITGASSGFGELIARTCAARGARLVLAARSLPALEQLAADLGGPTYAVAVAADVTDDAAVTQLAAHVLRSFGRVDVLVNNAGFGVLDTMADARLSDLQAMMDVNVYGALRCTRVLLPHMRARGSGQIVMMASMAGSITSPGLGQYCATKHALVALSRTLTTELDGSGIRVAMICPGVAQTGFQQRADPAKFSRISKLSATTAEAVATVTADAIARGLHGEVVVPWYGRLMLFAGQLSPWMTRKISRIVG